ncbi:MAG: purine nucleoside phosphorylase [Planctomycetota bacterium]|jgi:purine nucleoside phosphorylase
MIQEHERLGVPASMDESVTAALSSIRSAGTPDPDLLIFAATGTAGLLPGLEGGVRLELKDAEGTPPAFQDLSLHAGTIGATSVWICEDAPNPAAGGPSWTRAFPVWLAAAAGAKFLIHTSAGTGLDGEGAAEAPALTPESIVRVTDHINLSGTTPLLGLGKSRLGPLFPDQTRLHDVALAALASAVAEAEEITLLSSIAACTIGPALSTPAELESYRKAGAGIAVQRLCDPLIAAAHAGLGALALTAITDLSGEQPSIADMVLRASRVAPKLDLLVTRIARDAASLVASRREESPA